MKKAKLKSQQALNSFTKYCKENPEERFWQALRNWCGHAAILVRVDSSIVDTFRWEGLEHLDLPIDQREPKIK